MKINEQDIVVALDVGEAFETCSLYLLPALAHRATATRSPRSY
jgi:hypothetical protein